MFIGILELSLVMLSHNELEVSLPEMKEFFNQFLSVLITYATEGTHPQHCSSMLVNYVYVL